MALNFGVEYYVTLYIMISSDHPCVFVIMVYVKNLKVNVQLICEN
jgi:hypothetical protein